MRSEPRSPVSGRDRLVTALFAALVTALVGGMGALLFVTSFRDRVEDAARRDAHVIGMTVARTLAHTFERAAGYGIPFKLLPGVETYFDDVVARTPGVTRIVLRGADGRELRASAAPSDGAGAVSVPILLDGISMGQVEVFTSPATLSTAFAGLNRNVALIVALCALMAGVWAGSYAGSALARSRERLAALLGRTAKSEIELGASPRRRARGAVGAAFAAVFQGAGRIHDRRAAFLAYADELLAVDFDGSMRQEVERLRRDVVATSPDPSPSARGR